MSLKTQTWARHMCVATTCVRWCAWFARVMRLDRSGAMLQVAYYSNLSIVPDQSRCGTHENQAYHLTPLRPALFSLSRRGDVAVPRSRAYLAPSLPSKRISQGAGQTRECAARSHMVPYVGSRLCLFFLVKLRFPLPSAVGT